MKLIVITAAAACLNSVAMEYNRNADNPFAMRMYEQTFTVKYPDAQSAKLAKLEILPLPDGKEWAFSSRWDDNRVQNAQTRDFLAKYGCKGTFYLNRSSKRWNAKYARNLIQKGFSLGGHTMDHPFLPRIPRSAAFYQILANRIELEAEVDTPLNSFAFPYGRFSDKKDPSTHRDIAEYLYRAGYHHNTYNWFIKKSAGLTPQAISSVLPVQAQRNTSFKKADARITKNLTSTWRKIQPCMTLATHANQKGKDWDELEKILKKYSRNPKWWYCNHTEYAAYRYQYHHSKIVKKSLNGSEVTYTISRPHPSDLGDDIYLSLKNSDGKIINLEHVASKRTPQMIDYQPAGKKFSDIKVSLNFVNNKLFLTARNRGQAALKNIYYKFIYPPAYSTGSSSGNIKQLQPGKTIKVDANLPQKSSDKKYLDGKQYYAAMVEMNYKNKPIRIWCSVQK